MALEISITFRRPVVRRYVAAGAMSIEATFTESEWRYLGRSAGGPTVFEVYRIPANGKALTEQDLTRYPELLLADGTWATRSSSIDAILREHYSGNFDIEEDEISGDVARQLFEAWKSTEWPGRPY